MEVDSSPSKKRPRTELSEIEDSSPPTKKQKLDHTKATEEKSKESTPPLVIDKDDKKSKPTNTDKPELTPAPSTGMIEKKKRERKPGLAKVPSNVLEFNGLILEKKSDKKEMDIDDTKEKEKNDKNDKKVSDKEEADETTEEEKKEEKKVDIDRQKLINEVRELLAPCSRELIQKRKIECVIWFDQDDDGNTCLWIASIMETKFDECADITCMLATFPGYNKEMYWLPIIFKNKWLVYQPNEEILLSDKYKDLWHKNNFKQCKKLLTASTEYLSEMSESSDYEIYTAKPKKKAKKKRKYKKKKDRIKTKRKKACAATTTTTTAKKKYYPPTTKYSHGDKRIQSLNDIDPSTISFTPVSKKHLVPPADTSAPEVDHELIEILFSFDTTGSMSSCLQTVRSNLKNILNLLFRDIPKIRISILAHGDYCDENVYYVMRWVDFTTAAEKEKLINFVDSTSSTGGGDAPECYELVMHNAARQMSWSKNCVNRSLVLIGDANPHELNRNNPYKLDWQEKAKDCKSCGIKIYGIHCLSNFASKNFYETISEITGGLYITLDKIQSFAGMMVALCHREKDLITYDGMDEAESKVFKQEKKEWEECSAKLVEFSVLGLKEMLKYNGQKVSGTKSELISRIVDCKMYGCMPRCVECGGGHLRVIYINGKKYGHGGKGRYFCPGYYDGDEYVACLWSGDQSKIKREKWREIDDGDDDGDDNAHNKNK